MLTQVVGDDQGKVSVEQRGLKDPETTEWGWVGGRARQHCTEDVALNDIALFKFSVASVYFKYFISQRNSFRFLVSFGSLKIPQKWAFLSVFTNFSTIRSGN